MKISKTENGRTVEKSWKPEAGPPKRSTKSFLDKTLDRWTKKKKERRFKLLKSGIKEGNHYWPYKNDQDNREYYELLNINKLGHWDKMDKFPERHKLLKLPQDEIEIWINLL